MIICNGSNSDTKTSLKVSCLAAEDQKSDQNGKSLSFLGNWCKGIVRCLLIEFMVDRVSPTASLILS